MQDSTMPDITHELNALHVRFTIALDELGKHWGKPGMAEDVVTLTSIVTRAEHLLPACEHEEDLHGTAFQVRVIGLRSLLILSRNELERARAFAIAEVARRMRDEVPPLRRLQ
jgi:hypothetical protein